MEIVTRKEALSQGLKTYFTGKPCKHGHISMRDVATSTCRQCAAKFSQDWYSTEVGKAQGRARAKRWAEQNPERKKQAKKDWKSDNKGAVKASHAKRRAAKLQRTPAWADFDKIQSVYDNCPEGWHVDHIIPLQGEFVSGLHVHTNLQHLPAPENLSKKNSFDQFIMPQHSLNLA